MDESRVEPDADYESIRRAVEFEELRVRFATVAGSAAPIYEARARGLAETTPFDLVRAMEHVEEAVLGTLLPRVG